MNESNWKLQVSQGMNVERAELVAEEVHWEPHTACAALRFPENFLWGVATSATQVEGNVANEWTDFIAPDGLNCHRACDHFTRYREDIEWMRKLGVNAYRFSVEWSRLQSAPHAPLNAAEVDRLRDKLDCLHAAGIQPMLVLHHFSNPLWIYHAGGWTNPATVLAFENFVTQLVSALRDRVRIWNTFNEPDTYSCCSYLLGEFPPFKKLRLDLFRRVINHMGAAHRRACEFIRHTGSALGPVEAGFTKNWTFFSALKPNRPWDWFMAETSHTLFNRQVMQAFTRDQRNAAATFQGMNFYGRVRFYNGHSLTPARGRSRMQLAQQGILCDDMFERYPPGMTTALTYLHRRTRLPIYVTEHGAATTDETFRIADLRANLRAMHQAIQSGVDVRGFFYWSLLDNFEWQFGYTKKFGLLAVNFAEAELPRTQKPSAEFYTEVCRGNRVS